LPASKVFVSRLGTIFFISEVILKNDLTGLAVLGIEKVDLDGGGKLCYCVKGEEKKDIGYDRCTAGRIRRKITGDRARATFLLPLMRQIKMARLAPRMPAIAQAGGR
jgi:hypothetical protein